MRGAASVSRTSRVRGRRVARPETQLRVEHASELEALHVEGGVEEGANERSERVVIDRSDAFARTARAEQTDDTSRVEERRLDLGREHLRLHQRRAPELEEDGVGTLVEGENTHEQRAIDALGVDGVHGSDLAPHDAPPPAS